MDNKLQVLVADDEQGMRMAVNRVLRDFVCQLPEIDQEIGFTVLEAETGEAAMEIIERENPDILLLDLKLPGMSGLDVLSRLEHRDLDLITVMITAYASIETAVTATKRGAYDFLAKPFTPDELKITLRKTAKHLILQREARRLTEEKKQIRFQFLSVLAHELKAPIAAVEGYLGIVKNRSAGEDQVVYDKMLDRSMVRLEGMRKMILDLLDLTRIESGQKKREVNELDAVEVARIAVDTFLPSAMENKVTVSLDAPDSLPFRGDRGELEIVFNNLISNAIKYNKEGGEVNVRLENNGEGALKIAVSDTGIGMTPEEKERLFGEFVRIKNEKTRNIMGSGLGLSIVKKLTNLYNGEIQVDSEKGFGTTFQIKLRQLKVEAE